MEHTSADVFVKDESVGRAWIIKLESVATTFVRRARAGDPTGYEARWMQAVLRVALYVHHMSIPRFVVEFEIDCRFFFICLDALRSFGFGCQDHHSDTCSETIFRIKRCNHAIALLIRHSLTSHSMFYVQIEMEEEDGALVNGHVCRHQR